MTGAAVYLILGLALLLAIVLPQLTQRIAVSPPMVLVALGMLIGLLPLPDGVSLEPEANRTVILHVTELCVLVSLMGVGLAIDRALDLRSWSSWRTWSPVWRLLAVTMPVTILGVALLGWWVAVWRRRSRCCSVPCWRRPTRCSPPTSRWANHSRTDIDDADQPDEDRPRGDDDIRFSLTAEAGLNDGLAFPFVHLALLLLAGGFAVQDAATWLGWYVAGKIVLGGAGRPRCRLAAGASGLPGAHGQPPAGRPRRAAAGLAGLLATYGAAELLGGYGFLAVFACAMSLRASESRHSYHRAMHALVERLERLITLMILLVLGMAMTRGLLEHLDWRGVVVGLALVLVVRPLAGTPHSPPSRAPNHSTAGSTGASGSAVAFFGVRGVGSLYYLAYATSHHEVPGESWLWSTVAFTVVISVLLHGVTATPAMSRLDARRAASR